MAVTLETLYKEVIPEYDVELVTESCFGKVIEWMHVVEDIEFAKLLHGDELVFNAGLHFVTKEWILEFITELNNVGAGGLIISLREGGDFPKEVVEYANSLQFPLFKTEWNTPYVDIMRLFASLLLKNEQKETNLIAALKNAIFYPGNEESYLHHFERHGYYRDDYYTVAIVSCIAYETEDGNPMLERLEKRILYSKYQLIVYKEHNQLVILIANENLKIVQESFQELCRKDENVYVGIGTREKGISRIHESYEHALTAYNLTKTALQTNILVYENLGIYKLLSGVRNQSLEEEFVEETLGELLRYDREQHTEYTKILGVYFENECNIVAASKKLFCHKNTLTYKLSKIKEILGFDILTNENRTKIMLAFYLLKMKL